jgi:superfamily II DNA or RNA helicase
MDTTKLTIPELKQLLKKNKLSTAGNKAVLLGRLQDLLRETSSTTEKITASGITRSISTEDRDFSTFINSEFAQFRLKTNKDMPSPCESTTVEIKKLLDHQKFLQAYMKYHDEQGNDAMNSRGLLVYWGLGSGKTLGAIRMAQACRGTGVSLRKVIVLIPASLRNSPWASELMQQTKTSSIVELAKMGISLVHYNSNEYMNQLKTADDSNPFDNAVVVVDEIHNILNTLAKNSDSKRRELYNLMMTSVNTKYILLSGTPITNVPYEIAFAMNILRGQPIFDVSNSDSEERFMDRYYQDTKMIHKEEFGRKIQGLISYYSGLPETVFPKKQIHRVQVPMSSEQWQSQVKIFNEEVDVSKHKTRVIGVAGSDMESQIKTLQRARALNVRGELRKVLVINSGLDTKEDESQTFFIYSRENSNFSYPRELAMKYAIQNQPLIVDKNKLQSVIEELQLTSETLKVCSPKMTKIIQTIELSEGPTMVFSNFEAAYGIQIFVEAMKAYGYANYMSADIDTPKFAVWSGQTSPDERESILKVYNSDANKHGELIKVLCITTAGKEGISLRGVRQIHVMEPWWNTQQTQQVVGRGVRICSHYHLPKDEQVVDIYNYVSVPPTSTDEFKEAIEITVMKSSIHKQKKTIEILELMKQSAIDCGLNQAQTNVAECIDNTKYPHSKVSITDSQSLDFENASVVQHVTVDGQTYYMVIESGHLYSNNVSNPEYIGKAIVDSTGVITGIKHIEITKYIVVIQNGRKYLQAGSKLYQYLTEEELKIGLKPMQITE